MKTRLNNAILRIVIYLLCIFLGVGCVSAATYLKWKQVKAGNFMKTEAGKQAYNTIRFETYGAQPQHLFGYILYKDGIEVDMGEGGVPFTQLGKKTMAEVMTDYTSIQKKRGYSFGSVLIVREIYRDKTVAAYTAADINISTDVWDITKEGGQPTLRLVYEDRRQDRDSGEREGLKGGKQ